MAVHKLLVDDFDNDDYLLLAIHCAIDDYRLAYLLNQYLYINLKRYVHDLDFEQASGFYSIYQWEDLINQSSWNLISNICIKEEDDKAVVGSLFESSSKVIKKYNLIPEHKAVNYFLKIVNDDFKVNIKQIISEIQRIPQVVTVYDVNIQHLKSKNNLIFN